MIEAPEAALLAAQLNGTVAGKRIEDVIVLASPHKFAWFYGDPAHYEHRLKGRTVGRSRALGGMVETETECLRLLFTDGVNLRYYPPEADLPSRHQLLIGFEDQSCLVASVRMYGALICFEGTDFDSPFFPYYQSARDKPQVLSEAFDLPYFLSLANDPAQRKKTVKALLATGQTVPGVGNGVLQDILFRAGIHPKTPVGDLTPERKERLFEALKSTLKEMLRQGGRQSETDLSGHPGGYVPFLSKDTVGKPCPRCGETLRKENFLGGAVYFCPECQR